MKILDHGYVKLVETWGSDERIIEAARMSTAKGFLGWGAKCTHCALDKSAWTGEHGTQNCGDAGGPWEGRGGHEFVKPGDEKLLAYLWDNKHATPFEMSGAIIEVQAPIFVFREWHRHRTQSYNELSARYTPLPDVNYIPTVGRLMMNSDGKNKQAGTITDAPPLTEIDGLAWLADLADVYEHAERVYKRGLALGVPKELARLPVPVARYSRMRASANLRNWLGFLSLRSDKNPGAQWEIRQFANALHDLLVPLFPRTLTLFDGGAS